MLFLNILVLIATPVLSFANQARGLRGSYTPHVIKHGMFPASYAKQSSNLGRRALIGRRQTSAPSSCSSGSDITTKAPKANIFAGLTDSEAADVTAFLHRQKSLNLTAAATATR